MAYVLNSTQIRAPHQFVENNSTQYAEVRTLGGTVGRDHFGSNKRVWRLEYKNTKKADYDTIKAIYDSYLSNSNAVSWEVTETNYTISSTTVHVDLFEREFSVRGTDYISDFTLILKEA